MESDIINGYAICFNDWALDKQIKNELGLLLIISSLCAEKGYCFASNQYLSKLFNEPVQTISRKIKSLEEKGIINITYKKSGNVVTDREIRLTKMLTAVNKNVNGAVNKNVKDNNINISSNINITRLSNNISINNIVEHLNKKANVHYKSSSKKTKELINARLNEGYTEEDFITVIDKKTDEWLGTEMEKYLRPDTLFSNSKFEIYLNQKIIKKKSIQEQNKEFFERKRKEIENEQGTS